MSLLVGTVLHGFCGGYFGRDHYNCCRVEAVGIDWVVIRDLEGQGLAFGAGRDIHGNLAEYRKPCPGEYGCFHEEGELW
jgi:hypothetical protein